MPVAPTTVGKQNTQPLAVNTTVAYQTPSASGGAAGTWNWELLNLGPGYLWVRWDGQDPVPNDPASLTLPPLTAYGPANTNRLAVATDTEATTITFAAG